MSYGKEFLIEGNTYLLEIFEKHVYIAHKYSEDKYTSLYEGGYDSLFWEQELELLEKLGYEEKLYAIVIKCLEDNSIINNRASYQAYIFKLIEDEHTKEEILSSSSDEQLIFLNYFPLKGSIEEFKRLTSSIIDGYKNT